MKARTTAPRGPQRGNLCVCLCMSIAIHVCVHDAIGIQKLHHDTVSPPRIYLYHPDKPHHCSYSEEHLARQHMGSPGASTRQRTSNIGISTARPPLPACSSSFYHRRIRSLRRHHWHCHPSCRSSSSPSGSRISSIISNGDDEA